MDSHREPEHLRAVELEPMLVAEELDPQDIHRAMARARQDPEAPIRAISQTVTSQVELEVLETPEGRVVRQWASSKAARGMQRRLLVAGTRRPRRTLVVGGR